MDTLAGVRRTPLNQYDSIVRPIESYLMANGVRIEHGVRVTDGEFIAAGVARRATAIHLICDGEPSTRLLGHDDLAFITLGSMTADSTYGDDHHVPELIRDKRDGAWSLWETLSVKAPDFGRPNTFDGNVDESKWESFTLAMHDFLLLQRVQELTNNMPGEGALMTFVESNWLLSIVVPHQPHFAGQPDDVSTLWGYGLFLDRPGNFVATTLAESTGRQILTELAGHLGVEDVLERIRATTTARTVLMPYITSQFARRSRGDRPMTIPVGAANFAFLGQYTEILEGVEFTVENSIRGAMIAVYGLLGLDNQVPPVYHGLHEPRVTQGVLAAAS
ncbi:myosin-crossreactive antigen [Nakamurella sp. UYEF19]